MRVNHLITYLNDHIAGSVAGISLAKHCLSKNRNTEFRHFLERLVHQLTREQKRLKKLVTILDGSESTAKKLGAWTLQRVGRLKLNNPVMAYTELSRVTEFETLLMGLQGQLRLWIVMEAYQTADSRLLAVDLAEARRSVEEMLEELGKHHLRASELAFGLSKDKALVS